MNFLSALRSAGSVVTGYALFAVSAFLVFNLSGQPPHQAAPLWFMVVSTILGMFFAFLGGYVSGLLAGTKPLGHAIGVASILFIGATISLAITFGKGAVWSQVTAIILVAPSAIFGGWVKSRRSGPA